MGLRGLHVARGGLWVGWSGITQEDLGPDLAEADARLGRHGLFAVHLSQQEERSFYGGVSNGVLWPLFHFLTDQIPVDLEDWEAYEAVNARFAEVAAAHWRPGDLVWIHDYQLMRVPALLRRLRPEARIGFFLHIPFPPADLFGILPRRNELLDGLLGADLVGVHAHGYLRNLRACLRRFRHLWPSLDRVRFEGRDIRFDVFPMGIAAAELADRAGSEGVVRTSFELGRSEHLAVMLGVDRLDYTKGIPRRLLAFETMLERHPELAGAVRLVQVSVPSRTGVQAYARFRKQVDELVGRINGRFGTPTWTPVHYMYRAVTTEELLALYQMAHVMLVTPLRDGMNLVAKEFAASRRDEDGVLVLSEFTGAADELVGALRVNPYDIDASAETYFRALTMPASERRERMRLLRDRVIGYDLDRWAEEFLSALDSKPDVAAENWPAVSIEECLARIAAAAHVRLLLDYDGTLVPFAGRPEEAVPDRELLQLLKQLAGRRETEVHLVSGRTKESLDGWFGDLPVGLHAEHGLWSRRAPAGDWRWQGASAEPWRAPVERLLARFVARTPGAILEPKSAGFAWHYRQVDPEVAEWQVNELRTHLADLLLDQSVEIFGGDRVLEVRPRGVHKGLIARAVAVAAPRNTIIVAIGDDVTDEDLFGGLPPGAISVAIGLNPVRGNLRLPGWEDARALLRAIAASGQEPQPTI